MKGFNKAKVYVEGKGIVKTSLFIDNGRILLDNGSNEELLVLPENLIVVPGFIDKHMHGTNKADSMYQDYKSMETICKYKAMDGVTSIYPTTMTQTIENIEAALENIAKYVAKPALGSRIEGVHLEGPFISKKYHGAQEESLILKSNVSLFKRFYELSNGLIKQVTIAPEEEADELIRYLAKEKIRVTIGHSNATYADVKHAVELGVTGITHTFNAQSPLHHREIGVVGSAMLFDELYCEIIADLVHVSEPAIKLLYKVKGKEKIILITDSIEATGLDNGEYQLGGQTVWVLNNEARLIDHTLAGSVAHMNTMIKKVKDMLNISLCDAVDMATITPAKFLGIDNEVGSILSGKVANLTVIDENLNVYMTIVNGSVVYNKLEG